MKRCTKCKAEKSVTSFGPFKKGRNGLFPQCKECCVERAQTWALLHPERAKAKGNAWYAKNRARDVLRRREQRDANLDHARVVAATYYQNNREAVLAHVKEYRLANREKVHARIRAAKARRRGAEGTHTFADVTALLESQKHFCANPFCKVDLRTTKKHLDHKLPISHGGSNWIENLQWLCATCNLSKSAKDNETWLSILAMEENADRSHNSDAAFRSGKSVLEAGAV